MDHKKIYNQIIEKAKLRGLDKSKLEGYFECHHVQPRCMDGQDNPENLVLLDGKEHFVCHALLCYIYKGNRKLLYAFHMMNKVDPSSEGTRYKSNGNKYKKFKESLINMFIELGRKNLTVEACRKGANNQLREDKVKGGKLGIKQALKNNPNHFSEMGKKGGKIGGKRTHELNPDLGFKIRDGCLRSNPNHYSEAGKLGGKSGSHENKVKAGRMGGLKGGGDNNTKTWDIIHNGVYEIINNLANWCRLNNLDYNKVKFNHYIGIEVKLHKEEFCGTD